MLEVKQRCVLLQCDFPIVCMLCECSLLVHHAKLAAVSLLLRIVSNNGQCFIGAYNFIIVEGAVGLN